MKHPAAVLISDIHYNISTLQLADKAMRMAIDKANQLKIPLIVAGDLHDTKANLRGECVNAMLSTFSTCQTECYILRGNHDALNEKSSEHSINFLRPYARIVENPGKFEWALGIYYAPYHHDVDELKTFLRTVPKGETIILHQGITSANMGDYIQDRSAIVPEDVSGLRIISGHYHQRQTIDLPNAGKWDYIGNPFTLSFGEASDPEKGFQVLYADGTLEFVPTNLRKHVVVKFTEGQVSHSHILSNVGKDDLVWVKVQGTREQLSSVSKNWLTKTYGINNLRYEATFTDVVTTSIKKDLKREDLLDSLIDGLQCTADKKSALKNKWRSLL